MRFQGFCGPAYTSQALNADAEDLANWYSERNQSPNAKSDYDLYPCPGFQSFVTVTDVGGRALSTMNGRTLAVMGSTVRDIFPTMTASASYGSVAQDNNPAQIAFNGVVGNQALIGSGTNGYNLELSTNVLTQVLTGKATQVGMLDGYGIGFESSTGRIYLSDLNDFTTWDPLQFIARADAADSWKAILINPPDVWAIGSLSGSVLYDAGTFPFPLAPRAGINFKWGIAAPFSIAAAGSSVLWLSQTTEGNGIVVRTSGYTPQPISNNAIETAIARYARDFGISDAEALVYQDQGHTFYCLTFPSANATWVYDLDEQQWHRRFYWDAANNQELAWRPRVHTNAFGLHLVGDRQTGTIAKMDVTFGTELDGSAIVRKRRTPGVFSEKRQIPIRRIEIYMETGVALQNGQGSAPIVMWRSSNDGGHMWGKQRRVSAGRVGQWSFRVLMNRFGIPRDYVGEMTVSDPIPWRIVDAFINNDARSRAA